MWEYLAVLFVGFWLGIAIFLYVSCYWVEEILDLPATPRDGAPRPQRGAGTSSASSAHARLKRLVGRVIEEAMSLPALAHYAQRDTPNTSREDTLDSRTYEDLLATAILNKVIERYQTESTGGRSGGASSGIHSASASPTPSAPSSSSVSPPHSPHSPPPHHDRDADDQSDSEWEHHDFSGQELVELPRRVPFPEFGGDIIHCTDSIELNDEILEEMSGSDLQAADGSWEENWLFQKKKVKTLQSVPVPMLVPNPNEDFKAMIGDRDVDDTTDLSDAATDSEEEQEYKSDIGRAIQSKTLIGGKNPTEKIFDTRNENSEFLDYDNGFTLDSEKYDLNTSMEVQEVTAEFESSNDSVVVVGIESGPLNKAEFAVDEIHRTLCENRGMDQVDSAVTKVNVLETNKENRNTLNNTEKEGEYEEEIAKPVQRYADSLRRQHYLPETISDKENEIATEESDLIPGSIADRERKKWLKCVDMPNNPYSAEAIQKRLNNKSTSAIFDFLTTKSNKDVKLDGPVHKEEENSKQNNEMKGENFQSTSPSPKILKDVLAEEVPQYKRFGRDYYVNEAKRSAGARRLHNISASSFNSINKSASLDHFDINDFNSTVSASSSLSELEATALHHNIVRAVMSPRNASPNFAINPIYENPDKSNKPINSDHYDDLKRIQTDKYVSERTNTHAINEQLVKKFNLIAKNEETKIQSTIKTKYLKTQNITHNQEKISIEYEDADEQSLFMAKPAYIEDETDTKFEDILKAAMEISHQEIMNSNLEEMRILESNEIDESLFSSSSLEDSIKIYNVPKGEIVKTCRDNQQNKDIVDLDTNDNIIIQDKNDNIFEKGNLVNDTANNHVTKMNGESIEEYELKLPKVKDLAKKFVSIENHDECLLPKSTPRRRKFSNDYELEVVSKSDPKLSVKNHNYMHSLTARSISKEFREELKLSMATPIKVPGGTNEHPDGILGVNNEDSRPGSPLPEPGTLKTKLAFFESLKF